MKIINSLLMLSIVSSPLVYAHSVGDSFSKRPDAHAPIGVMGEHLHKTGEWMLSNRYMNMNMEGLLRGDEKLSASTYRSSTPYLIMPTKMDMKMYMLGMMYAPSDDVTLMLGMPYISNDMTMDMSRTGASFSTESSGWGDAKLGALVRVPALSSNNHKLHANITLTLPTASLSARDDGPMMKNSILPYAMQTGFKTWQLEGGFTYTSHQTDGYLSWGGQLLWQSALENNDQHYKPGDKLTANAWLAYLLTPQLSVSIRLNHIDLDSISGIDTRLPRLMMKVSPTLEPDNYAMRKTSLLVGANYLFASGTLKGHRLAFELGRDIDESYDGIGMNSGTAFTLGWQKAF
ncbi:MAG: transporter [Gammaproteobacteria bacterium]|nr:transporter [Gammaproteobacteria bacterium]